MSAIDFPDSRAGAMRALEEWLPRASRYGATRNRVVPGHPHVSRLSPAIGCRLLLEEEVVAAVLERFSFSTVEKFVQEVYWRLYWKGWLEMRPAVWRSYREGLREIPCEECRRATEVMEGHSGVAVMDCFAQELVETGYLHNHARMWFAGYWVHVARLPWELGADFFLRHLLDGDAAANTLSWRWVAGLHTPGKTYLPRRNNLEKYLAPSILEDHDAGLERLEGVCAVFVADKLSRIDLTPTALVLDEGAVTEGLTGRVGLWIHEDDLSVERSPLADQTFEVGLATVPLALWDEQGYSEGRRRYLDAALRDGASRAASHFGLEVPVEGSAGQDFAATVAAWAVREELDHVMAMRPHVGPLGDGIKCLEKILGEHGIGLALYRRSVEEALFPHAKRGFFPFWKSCSGRIGQLSGLLPGLDKHGWT